MAQTDNELLLHADELAHADIRNTLAALNERLGDLINRIAVSLQMRDPSFQPSVVGGHIWYISPIMSLLSLKEQINIMQSAESLDPQYRNYKSFYNVLRDMTVGFERDVDEGELLAKLRPHDGNKSGIKDQDIEKTPMDEAEKITTEKINASEARTDAKFARLEGKIETLSVDLSAKMAAVLTAVQATNEKVSGFDKKFSEQRSEIKADFRASRALTVALFVFVLGAIGLMFNVGGTMFTRGMSVRDVVKAVNAEHATTPAK